jgi:wobble nucleotide-excising tRNase
MIESITIADVATYGSTPEALDGLSQFNFVFGSNGTGKTTVSRVIADESSFPTCKVTWKRGTKLQPMVYNLDFVDKNFYQSAELKGVFTLGEKHGGRDAGRPLYFYIFAGSAILSLSPAPVIAHLL